MGHVGDRTETAAFDKNGAFVKFLGRLDHLAVGAEHGRGSQTLRHKLQAHQPVIHPGKSRPAEADHIHFDALRGQIVEQAADQLFRLRVVPEGSVDQVDPDDAEGLLLRDVLRVEHADMDDDLVDRTARLGLETKPHPSVRLVVRMVAARRHRVGKDKKRLLRAEFRVEALAQEGELVLEHAPEALPADVAFDRAVNRVAEGHVVGGHGFGHRAGRRPDEKEPARDLLPRPDFGEGAVDAAIEVQLEGLAVDLEVEFVGRHKTGDHGARHAVQQRQTCSDACLPARHDGR